MEKLENQIFGNYKLLERLEGVEFSAIFKAVHTFTGRLYAIRLAYSSDPVIIKQLEEIYYSHSKNTIQLKHPNIIPLSNFFIEKKNDKTYFLLLSDFIEGQMLFKFLDANPNLSSKDKIKIAKQIGEALDYAHNFTYQDRFRSESKGIIHGDLQSRNIIVKEDLTTLITDFEILNTKRLFNYKGQLDATHKDSLEIHSVKEYFGTDATVYAPEQEKSSIVSVKSDIYNYGQILFHLFTGKFLKEIYPNGYWTKKEIKAKLPVKNLLLQRKLAGIIYKATQPNKEDRYDSIAQILKILSTNYQPNRAVSISLANILGIAIFIVFGFWGFQYLSNGTHNRATNFYNQHRNAEPLRTTEISNYKSGTYHALLIGNEQHKHLQDLINPIDDIERVKSILKEQYNFEDEHIRMIKDGSRSDIIEGLESLYATNKDDKVLILYAGHGKVDSSNKGFWMPIDAARHSMTHWISNEVIKKVLRDIPARHVLLISDACFSGSILRRRNVGQTYSTALHKKSRIALTSGSIESVPDHSVFIQYLAKYLQESPDSIITASELFAYLQEPVKVNSPDQNDPGYGPIKDSGHEGGDFFFLRKKGEELQ